MQQKITEVSERITETVKPVLTSAIEKTAPILTSAIEKTIGSVERIDPDSANRDSYFRQEGAGEQSAAQTAESATTEEQKAPM